MISIAIPRTNGGGAEVFTRQFATWLKSQGNLSKIYTAFGDPDFSEESVPLGELRATNALAAFWRKSSVDCANSFLLTLGYINFAACLRLKGTGKKIVIRICNPPSEEMKLLKSGQKLRYWLATRIACAAADHIVVQSNHMKESMLSTVLASDQKISVIHNPVRESAWKLRNTKRPFDYQYILCASSNKPQKDLPTLISAFANIKSNTRRNLLIAGVSPTDPQIIKIIEENKIESGRLRCLGFVDNIFPLIEHADLCVLPSLFEGFSNFLLEAAAYGKKIIATDCPGGNSDLFSHYSNHVTVPLRDPEALGVALLSDRNDLDISETRMLLAQYSEDRIYGEYVSLLEGI